MYQKKKIKNEKNIFFNKIIKKKIIKYSFLFISHLIFIL